MNKAIQKTNETFPEKIGENAEEISMAIAKIARGMEVLGQSRLRRSTILLLLSHSSKVSQRDCDSVLQALSELEKKYLK